MTHTLTVGYDGSPPASRALLWAAGMAARDDATLQVVSCFTAPGVVDPWYLAAPTDIDKIRAAVDRDLTAAVERVRTEYPELRVERQVVCAKPRTELVQRAVDSDLLVVGTTGAGAAESLLLGSVAHAVARASSCPVALVPDVPASPPVGRVIVGVDGSPAADRAVEWAIAEADRRSAALVLLHAWQYEYPDESTSAQGRDLLRIDAALALEGAAARARELTLLDVTTDLVEGRPADAIVAAAVDADLVVLGTRGRGSLRSALFGSVAHEVASRSSRPIVVVREVPA